MSQDNIFWYFTFLYVQLFLTVNVTCFKTKANNKKSGLSSETATAKKTTANEMMKLFVHPLRPSAISWFTSWSQIRKM